MTAIFGKNERPYEHIWMPATPTYTTIRHSTWDHNPGARTLALRQKDVYDNKGADLLADSGGHRVAMEMVSRTAAEAAVKIIPPPHRHDYKIHDRQQARQHWREEKVTGQ